MKPSTTQPKKYLLHQQYQPISIRTTSSSYTSITIVQYVSQCIKQRFPMWQQFSVLSYGDSLALFRISPTHQQLTKFNNVEAHLLRIPLEDISKCIGLAQVYGSNVFIWVPMNQIVDMAFISHAEVVQNSFL